MILSKGINNPGSLLECEAVPGEEIVSFATVSKGVTIKRRVSFCDEVMAYRRKDPLLRLEEVQARWLQPDEISLIRKSLNSTLSLLRAGAIVDETKCCTRGIEHLVGVTANRKARRLVVHSVLTEQDLQRYEGINDTRLVAESSREFSAEHRERGYFQGLCDQREGCVSLSSKMLLQVSGMMSLKRVSVMSPCTRAELAWWARALAHSSKATLLEAVSGRRVCTVPTQGALATSTTRDLFWH